MENINIEQLNKHNGEIVTAKDFKQIDDNFLKLQDTINNGELIWKAIVNNRNKTNILDGLNKDYITQEQADVILKEIIK